MELQNSTVDATVIIDAKEFLRKLSDNETVLGASIRDVLGKHVDGNAVIMALVQKNDPFYRFAKTKLDTIRRLSNRRVSSDEDSDHEYGVGQRSSTFREFVENRKKESSSFDIGVAMENFKPASHNLTRCEPWSHGSRTFQRQHGGKLFGDNMAEDFSATRMSPKRLIRSQ